jgi:hypothetical protein
MPDQEGWLHAWVPPWLLSGHEAWAACVATCGMGGAEQQLAGLCRVQGVQMYKD